MTVLLVGGRTSVALFLARRFAAAGARVVAADCYRGAMLGQSRSVARMVHLPSPRFAPAAFAARLRAVAREEQVAHVVPTGEEAFAVAGVPDLPGRVWAPPPAALAALHDKGTFAARVAALDVAGVRAPRTWTAPPFPPGPAVVKPRRGRFGVGVRLVGPGEAPDPAPGDLVQERVVGDEVCALAWADRGAVVAFAAYRPTLRFPRGPGVVVAATEAPALRRLADRLAADLAVDGALAFDAIVEPSGAAVPIECNPRATSGIYFLPDLASRVLGAGPGDAVDPGPFVLGPAGALGGLRHAGGLGRWWRAVRAARDVFWDPRDPVPWASQVLVGPHLAWLAARHGVSLAEATTWLTRPD